MEDAGSNYWRVEVERTEPANVRIYEKRIGPSADDRQRLFANHLMLLKQETVLVVNDKEKRERRFLQMIIEELNRLNQRLKPCNAIHMSEDMSRCLC